MTDRSIIDCRTVFEIAQTLTELRKLDAARRKTRRKADRNVLDREIKDTVNYLDSLCTYLEETDPVQASLREAHEQRLLLGEPYIEKPTKEQ